MPLFSFGTKESYPDLPVRITNLSEYSIVRDDLLPLGLGTKWRKAWGVIYEFPQHKPKRVLIWGAIHGNYLASFVLIFRNCGFFVETITYTKDPKLKTYNESIVRTHSHTIHCYANRTLAREAFIKKSEDFHGYCFPEFGLVPNALLGLGALWKDLHMQMPNNASLLLEIGSGASFLSAFDFFQETNVNVYGVMVGESKTSWLSKREGLQRQLGLKIQIIPEERIWEKKLSETITPNLLRNTKLEGSPASSEQKSSRFGKGIKNNIQWIQDYYERTHILLEPVYSANSLRSLVEQEFEKLPFPNRLDQTVFGKGIFSSNIHAPIFYLHQGGQVQHLDIVFPKPKL